MFGSELQRSSSASLVDSIDQIRGNEQAFLESLESLIISTGTSQQHCIAQLRSLGLPDDFWMYVFKVVPCSKTYSHKWTLCPCAHAGETARRRDPRVVSYKAVLCPIVKGKKTCPLGDACSYAHNVFEHWLHPSRYKTRLCSFGRNCNRPICFFAHSADELRCVPNADEGKEVDEREYMLQVMMAQESSNNLLAARTLGSISQPATPMNGINGMNAFCPPSASTPNTPFGAFLDLPQGQGGGPQHQHSMPPLSPSAMASFLNASPIRVKPNMAHNLPALTMAHSLPVNDAAAAMQLMQLQEALAALNIGNMDGLGSMAAATPSTAAAAAAAANRSSDPGFNTADAAAKVLSSMQVSRTISESGPQLASGMVSASSLPAGLESLLPFMNSLSGAPSQQAPQQHMSQGPNSNTSGMVGSGIAPPTPTHSQPQPQPAGPSSGASMQKPPSPPGSPTAPPQRSSSPGGSSTSSLEQQVQQQQHTRSHMQRQMSDSLSMLSTYPHGPMGNPSRQPPLRAVSGGPAMLNSMGNAARQQQQQQQPSAQQQQVQAQALQALAAAAAASGGPNAINASAVNKIVSELQEQGLAGSKDQLVASLSQLLAQLLSPNN